MEVRDRYAPSPTGLQHVGGLRTALFNYLFAKSQNGKFILRLEDTDRTRFDKAYVDNLYSTFEWLGFHWDEGPDTGGPYAPYVQSERSIVYKKYAHSLVENGAAYYCFCSAERLDAVRREREAAHSSESGYDRHCRNMAPDEAAARAVTEPHTIRLKIPLGEKTLFNDALLGSVEWKNDDVSPDPVLLKSDGFPTYHLANVVDDHLMGITHILRAQEWLSSTPLHIILYRAFGWEPPLFCHLPMVMGQDGKKLSKRHGAASIDEFRKNGILPDTLVNYVALLGASYEEGKEIYTLDELCARFSLEKLNKAPAVFDYKKLEWYNAQYIRMKTDAALAALALPFAVQTGLFGAPGSQPSAKQLSLFNAAIPLVKERAVFLCEIPEKLAYLFSEPSVPEAAEFIPKKSSLEEARRLLSIGRELAAPIAGTDDEGAEKLAKEKAEKEGLKLVELLTPLRVAVTGSRVSPPLFGSIRLLGAESSLTRIDRALEKLNLP
ncbi:MAG: glutamate--tRNA ligase [Spirochaetaceae bacterium]|jgi:glutamyl-tRNA synthetase|nr:glutamate--tRNA ligase [Spirochaetaceae bacterium]